MINKLCKDIVVDKNHYYIPGELVELKNYVLTQLIEEQQQKVNKANSKLKQLKFR